jgi:ureidoacrylate peracid hydrolase
MAMAATRSPKRIVSMVIAVPVSMSSSVMRSQPADPVVSKNRLTPFADPSRAMERLLRARDIDKVLSARTVTNVCCECTARNAAMRNFKKIMISEANAAHNGIKHNAKLSIFLQAFGGVIDTDDALRLIAGAP